MMRSDASLKGKIKEMAKKTNLKPQEILQMYLFERLLMRLEQSDYAQTFVLKGGSAHLIDDGHFPEDNHGHGHHSDWHEHGRTDGE